MKITFEFNDVLELEDMLKTLARQYSGEDGDRIREHEQVRYTAIFDEKSPNWTKDQEYNRLFLLHQQRYLSERLKIYGHVFLNEVFDALGLPRTNTGAVCGWIYRPDDPNYIGDNFIDFGLMDKDHDFKVPDFGSRILLDFNVDGCIVGKL